MIWENLALKKCPNCSGELYKSEDEMKCSDCYFHIHIERYNEIRSNRRPDTKPSVKIKIKWQMLHDGKCPICANYLKKSIGQYEILQCSTSECTFKIREDKLEAILIDPIHPANRWAGTALTRDEAEDNLSRLNNL